MSEEKVIWVTQDEIREAVIRANEAMKGRQDCDFIEELIKELGFDNE